MALYPVQPIDTLALFPHLSRGLNDCLTSITELDWSKPTACPGWSVKDLATHLLGGNCGRLKEHPSLFLDDPELIPLFELMNYMPNPESPFLEFDPLLDFINTSNQAWIDLASPFSSVELTSFIFKTDKLLFDLFSSVNLNSFTSTGVLWAGESKSRIWFDIAREYTEKWLHQQQIREAVQFEDLFERQWLHPALDVFVRALPHHFRDFESQSGSSIVFSIAGPAGGDWSLIRESSAWKLYSGLASYPISHLRIDQDSAWRLFTKGLLRKDALNKIEVSGDQSTAQRLVEIVAIMA